MSDTTNKKEKFIYQPEDSLMNRKINVLPIPVPEVGMDLNGTFMLDIMDTLSDSVAGNGLNIAKIESFCTISLNRNTIYDLIDTMLEDPTIAAVIEIYCEDATETNDKGLIMWVESADKKVAEYVLYLLNDLNIEKNIYRWANCLVKYGDVYLRLYHESEYEDDDLFEDEDSDKKTTLNESKKSNKDTLNEDVVLTTYKKSDNFVHYMNMISNPAEMFELTKFGKTYAYIQAPVTAYMDKKKDSNLAYGNYTYLFKKKDVHIFSADNFVHGCLDDLSSRHPEEVNLSLTTDDDEVMAKYTYSVRRGQSILYNTFKIWRLNMLLEYALLLNRLSRSSSVKIMNVEVGDLPKNQAKAKLMSIKNLIEQKSALATDEGMNEYTNSGPAENIIYVASHNGLGTVTTLEITSDLNVSGLEDVNLFKNKLYSSLKVPKLFIGDTTDDGGFDGGTSLSLISSRYAKTVKRILNVLILTITDAINILLIDKGYASYINKFTLRMQEPTTREEMDRKEAMVNRIAVVLDTMSLFDDIQDPVSRLVLLKNLLGKVSTDAAIIAELDNLIEKAKIQAAAMEGQEDLDGSAIDDSGFDNLSGDLPGGGSGGFRAEPGGGDLGGLDLGGPDTSDTLGGGELPTPEALGQDFVNM